LNIQSIQLAVAATPYVLLDPEFSKALHTPLRDGERLATVTPIKPIGLYAIATFGGGAVCSLGRKSEFATVDRVLDSERHGR
jgi:hypothetical protein